MDFIVHGFNVKDDGHGSVDKIKRHLRKQQPDREIRDIDYGWMHRARVRLCNKNVARTIASMVAPGSNVIAHSNGAALVYYAAKFGAMWNHVTLINPALDSGLAIKNARSVHVWYDPSDPWVSLATYIPWSIWGRQGRTGYTGDNSRTQSFNMYQIFKKKHYHSGVFSNPEALDLIAHKYIEASVGI